MRWIQRALEREACACGKRQDALSAAARAERRDAAEHDDEDSPEEVIED